MKCIRCQHDSKYKERSGGVCPNCGGKFAFEPHLQDPLTDGAFHAAIEAVSSNGQMRWGVEHLYYEACRRHNHKRALTPIVAAVAVLFQSFIAAMIVGVGLHRPKFVPPLILAIIGGTALVYFLVRKSQKRVGITPDKFKSLWDRWKTAHGTPRGVIVRQPPPAKARAAEPDLADYSFDRAVICDRARSVDVLLANNFHFENNCAVLSVDGYPRGPFNTVLAMLRRNPKLEVFVLHDVTPAGCTLARRLAEDPDWFQGHARVVDVGLKARHAKPFAGLWQPAVADRERLLATLPADDARWLTQYSLELAAIRPEQLLKRLFRSINQATDPAGSKSTQKRDETGTDGDVGFSDGADDSLAVDAGDSDGGADSFG
jgi:hypothetical protein